MAYISTPPKKQHQLSMHPPQLPLHHLQRRLFALDPCATGRSAVPTRRGDAMSSDAALAARDFFGGTLGGMTGDSTEQIGDLSHRLGWENPKS